MTGGSEFRPAQNDNSVIHDNQKLVHEILFWAFNYSTTLSKDRDYIDFTFLEFIFSQLSLYYNADPEERCIYWNYVFDDEKEQLISIKQEIHPLTNLLQQIRFRLQYEFIFKPPKPADQQQTAPRENMDDRLSKSTADVIAAVQAGGESAAAVSKAFAQANLSLPLPTTADLSDAAEQLVSANHPDAWGPHIPAFAPRRWKMRDKTTEKDPAKFIREEYAEWMPYLANGDLIHLDKTLYFRYADWKSFVEKSDMSDAEKSKLLVDFGVSSRLDDAERGRRARERNKVSKANARDVSKGLRDNSPQPDSQS